MSHIRITCDAHEVIEELDRLMRAPDERCVMDFESMLGTAFLSCLAQVHVITGSLKGSGKIDSDHANHERWQGCVHFSGASPGGIHDPVDYGIYELARGGPHFFFDPAEPIMGPERMQDAIHDFMARGKDYPHR